MTSYYDKAVFSLAEFIEDEFRSDAKVEDVEIYIDMIVKEAYKQAWDWSGNP